MDVPNTDPWDGEFPEVIEEVLYQGNAKCVAFNRRGTLLAAGCSDGSCVIWDFLTRGNAKELRNEACKAPITSVCWSKNGRFLLASAIDKSLTLWNVLSGEIVIQRTLNQTTLKAHLYPGSSTPSLCLASFLCSAPVLVDLNTGSSTVLPCSVFDAVSEITNLQPPNKFIHGSPLIPIAATFDKHGDLIYIGNSVGEVLIVDINSIRINAIVTIPGSCAVKDIVFSRNGQYLLTNSSDRVVRVYENLLQRNGSGKDLKEKGKNFGKNNGIEKLREVGAKCLRLLGEFQDAVTKTQWKSPCFSGDCEWIISASASKGNHKLYIWDRTGRHLVKILEGPKEPLIDLCWHPIRHFVVSVSTFGKIYIWAKEYAENWSAFAPDFKELEENEEYVEREDEFDINPDEPEKMQVDDMDMDEYEEVDIMTVERDLTFSELDESEEELCYLPANPLSVTSQQQGNVAGGGSQTLENSNQGNLAGGGPQTLENSNQGKSDGGGSQIVENSNQGNFAGGDSQTLENSNQDKSAGEGSQTVENSNHSASDVSVEEVHNSQSVPPAPSLVQATDHSAKEETSKVTKRQRKPSAKGLEFAEEMARKPTRRRRRRGKSSSK